MPGELTSSEEENMQFGEAQTIQGEHPLLGMVVHFKAR